MMSDWLRNSDKSLWLSKQCGINYIYILKISDIILYANSDHSQVSNTGTKSNAMQLLIRSIDPIYLL